MPESAEITRAVERSLMRTADVAAFWVSAASGLIN